jgi:hypothetical protein
MAGGFFNDGRHLGLTLLILESKPSLFVKARTKYNAIMSKQFLYAELRFIQKVKAGITHTASHCEVVVEVPKDVIQCKHSESLTGNSEEKIIALGIAKIAALGTFPKAGERVAGMYEEGVPIWHEERPLVMNKRPCDHEENGTRAWRVVSTEK